MMVSALEAQRATGLSHPGTSLLTTSIDQLETSLYTRPVGNFPDRSSTPALAD